MALRFPRFWRREQNQADQVISRIVPMFGTPQPLHQAHDLEKFGREGYRQNVVIRACIDEIAKSAAEPRMLAEQVSEDQAEELKASHPLAMLLSRPNRLQSQYSWLEQMVIDLMLFGNQYTHKIRAPAGNIGEIWNLRPFLVKIVPSSDGMVFRYEFKRSATETVKIEPQDVSHLKLPDPMDDFYGLAPIVSALRAADLDNQATDYLRAFFKNAGVLSGYLKFITARLKKEERERIKQLWLEEHSGPHGWHSTSVMDADVDYKELGSTIDKLKLDHIFDQTESRICAAFQVPPIIIAVRLGLMRSTFSNYREARISFWRETLIPMYERIADQITRDIAWEFGEDLRVRFDVSDVEELQEGTDSLRKFALQLWEQGLGTKNEARQLIKLPSLGPDGDKFKTKTTDGDPVDAPPAIAIPIAKHSTAVPAKASEDGSACGGQAPLAPAPPPELSSHPVRVLDAATPSLDDEYKALHRVADNRRRLFTEAYLRNRGLAVSKEIEDKIADAFARGRLDEVERVNGWYRVEEGLLKDYTALTGQTAVAGARISLEYLPKNIKAALRFDLVNPLAEKFASEYTYELVQGITRQSMAGLRKTMHAAFNEGLPPRVAAKRIQQIVGLTEKQTDAVAAFRIRAIERLGPGPTARELAFAESQTEKYAAKVLRRRAVLIARTETIRASSEGQRLLWQESANQGLLDADKVRREWIITPDDRLCTHICLPMAGQRVALDAMFVTGDGAEVTAPPAHPACRCATGLVLT